MSDDTLITRDTLVECAGCGEMKSARTHYSGYGPTPCRDKGDAEDEKPDPVTAFARLRAAVDGAYDGVDADKLVGELRGRDVDASLRSRVAKLLREIESSEALEARSVCRECRNMSGACPVCGGEVCVGEKFWTDHAPDCALAALLRECEG